MTCREAEPLLALLVEGDLMDPCPVQSHLAVCAQCAATLSELHESQALLHALAGSSPSEIELRAVRLAVGERIPSHRAWWPGAAAAAALLAAIGIGAHTYSQKPVPALSATAVRWPTPPPGAVSHSPVVETAHQLVYPTKMRRTARHVGIRAVALQSVENAAELHIQTYDPQVLIVLVPERGENTDESR